MIIMRTMMIMEMRAPQDCALGDGVPNCTDWGTAGMSVPNVFSPEGRIGSLFILFCIIHLSGAFICGLGRKTSFKVADDDLFLLDLFISCEEMSDFLQHMLISISYVIHGSIPRITNGDRNNFLIRFAAIGHMHDTDGAGRNEDTGRKRMRGEQNDIKRVTIIPERLRDESVIKWVVLRAMENAVKFDDSRLLIYLVLIMRTLWDLDDDVHFFFRARIDVMQ